MIETLIGTSPVSAGAVGSTTAPTPEREDIAQRFEQMLWAEMLSHAGLEKAVTQGGGEAASAFSRYVVEAIAKDLAAAHPLGLTREGSAGTLTALPETSEPG